MVLRRKSIAGTQPMPEIEDLQEVDAMLEENATRWETQYKNQCIAIGRAEKNREVAQSLLHLGMLLAQISEVTGLTFDEIKGLCKLQ